MSSSRDRIELDAADLERRIRAMPAAVGPSVLEPTRALFLPLHAKEPYKGVAISRDLTYGADPRHRLDVFAPEKRGGAARPVLLFVHGGGFTGGDKSTPGQPFYDNIGVWAVEHGMVGVAMTYRLAPQHQWPAAGEDIARAVAWVRESIAAHGGDPARIFLMGHSAGAAHAAAYAAHPEFHGRAGAGLAGFILVAGLYNIASCERNAILASYYGNRPEAYAARSSLPQIAAVKTPVMIAVGEREPADFQRQALEMLRAAFERDGRLPRFAVLYGHNHYSEIMAFNLPYRPDLARHIVDFVTIDCATK
jgi:triacylglycerol lipase